MTKRGFLILITTWKAPQVVLYKASEMVIYKVCHSLSCYKVHYSQFVAFQSDLNYFEKNTSKGFRMRGSDCSENLAAASRKSS